MRRSQCALKSKTKIWIFHVNKLQPQNPSHREPLATWLRFNKHHHKRDIRTLRQIAWYGRKINTVCLNVWHESWKLFDVYFCKLSPASHNTFLTKDISIFGVCISAFNGIFVMHKMQILESWKFNCGFFFPSFSLVSEWQTIFIKIDTLIVCWICFNIVNLSIFIVCSPHDFPSKSIKP